MGGKWEGIERSTGRGTVWIHYVWGKIYFKEKEKYIPVKRKHFFSIISHFQNHYCQYDQGLSSFDELQRKALHFSEPMLAKR